MKNKPLKYFISGYSKPDKYFPSFTSSRYVPECVEVVPYATDYRVFAKYENAEWNRIIAIVETKQQARKIAKEYIKTKILNHMFLN